MQLVLNGDTRPIPFLLVSSTDHITGLTGATPTVTISKNGAAFASPGGTVSEVGNGVYILTPSATDTGTNGVLALNATATGGDPSTTFAQVVAFSPYNADLAANVVQIAGAAVATGTAQLGVNVVSYASGEDPATLVLAGAVETGIDVQQALQYIAAACAGVLSGASGTTVTIKAIGNAGTTRIVATVDSSGDRSAVTLS